MRVTVPYFGDSYEDPGRPHTVIEDNPPHNAVLEIEDTPEEEAFISREQDLVQAISTLRQWSNEAAATNVTSQNAVQVLNVVVSRLGVFFDRFADLLENLPDRGPR